MDTANPDQAHSRSQLEPDRFGSAIGFLQFARSYWYGATARGAWTLATAIAALLFLNLAVSIGLNNWQRWFFDMLERRDADMLPMAIVILPGLVLAGAAFAVAMVKCSMTLQLNWRRWVTDQLIRSWIGQTTLADTRFGASKDHGSAGYRIVQDVRLALDEGCRGRGERPSNPARLADVGEHIRGFRTVAVDMERRARKLSAGKQRLERSARVVRAAVREQRDRC